MSTDAISVLRESQRPENLDRAFRELSQDQYDHFEREAEARSQQWGIPRFPSRYRPDQWVEPLRAFLRNNSDKSPEELQDMAAELTPGSMHNNTRLFYKAMNAIFAPCPILRAAVIGRTWGGGKVGFQHLPDPRAADPDDYQYMADEIAQWLSDVDPTAILVGEDRAFYDALPERFTVYRGCAGIDGETAARGLCWTTKRDIAEWFANKSAAVDCEPILLSARVSRQAVLLAFAGEHEVVAQVYRWRQLKCRRRDIVKHRPEFAWVAPDNASTCMSAEAQQ